MLDEKKKLGLRDSTMILIGGMIGSAIFSLSGLTILTSGPASIISWIIAAIILFFYAFQTAELATIYPRSGGVYVFPAKALGKTEKQGRLHGWIASWAYQFGNVAAVIFSATYIGIYLGQGFPVLGGNVMPTVIAVLAVVLVGVLNLVRVSHMGKINTGITLVHVGTMGIFIVIALFAGKWTASNFAPFFTQGSAGATGFLGAIPIAMLAYGAIVAVAFMVGEIKDPKKTVPKAMSIAMTTTVIVYILMMVSTLGLITSQYLLANANMQYTPILAAVFTQLMAFPWLVYVIVITAVLGLFTTSLVCMALTTRTFQAAAEDGLYPKALAKIGKSGVPTNATVLTIIICGALTALSAAVSLINIVVNLGALCNVIVVAYICLAVVAARRKMNVPDRFKAPGGNVVSVIVLIVLVICYIPSIIDGGWMLWAWTGIYYAAGMIIYAIATRNKNPQLAKDKA